MTHHSRYDSSRRGIGPSRRPLPDNTQHSQETDIHAQGGIRTRNASKRKVADPRLRPLGYWDRCYAFLQMLTVSISRLHSLFTTSHDFFPSLKFQIRTTAITFDSPTDFLLILFVQDPFNVPHISHIAFILFCVSL